MTLRIFLFLFYIVILCSCEENDSTRYDTGFLGTCSYLQYLDLAIRRSNVTNNLRLLVASERHNEYRAYSMNQSSSVLSDANFNKEYKTVLFVHGFIRSSTNTLVETITSAYRIAGGHNILVLDTNDYTWTNYFWAARAAQEIGSRLGIVLYRLSRRGLNMLNFTLIGHSLGAHICGFAGKTFKNRTGYKLSFIAALDPIGPCFRSVAKRERLTASDAQFVEVIHTNGIGLGLMNTIGHMDLYFNGGRSQSVYLGSKCRNVCSHISAVSIWAASVVDTRKFLGVKCDSLLEMNEGRCIGGGRSVSYLGPDASRSGRGIYLVTFLKSFPQYKFIEDDCYTKASKWFGFSHGPF